MIKIGNWWFCDSDINQRRAHADSEWGLDPANESMIKQIELWFENKNRKHAVDVGANLGFMTSYFGKNWEQVTAFEPTPDIFECLNKNCNRPNIRLLNNAVSDQERIVLFAMNGKSEINQIISDTKFLKKHWTCTNVSAITLDSMNLTDVDIIKIDVEGHELAVITGAEKTIKRNKPLIVIEISYDNKILDKEVSAFNHNSALKTLEDYGYSVIWNHKYDWILEPV